MVGLSKYFICEPRLIKEACSRMELVNSEDDIETYVDSEGAFWEHLWYWYEAKDLEVELLQKSDAVSTDDLIRIATSASDENYAICASNELFRREKEFGSTYRDALLNVLTDSLGAGSNSSMTLERIRLIIYETYLYDATNRKPIVGKHVNDIMEEAGYYEDVVRRAKKILSMIKKDLGD